MKLSPGNILKILRDEYQVIACLGQQVVLRRWDKNGDIFIAAENAGHIEGSSVWRHVAYSNIGTIDQNKCSKPALSILKHLGLIDPTIGITETTSPRTLEHTIPITRVKESYLTRIEPTKLKFTR